MVVRVTDSEMRTNMFGNARRLSQDEGTKRVFIALDLTWQQREEDKKVKGALKLEAAAKTKAAKTRGGG